MAEKALANDSLINLAEAQEFVRKARLQYAQAVADNRREHDFNLSELIGEEANLAMARSSLLEAASLMVEAAKIVEPHDSYAVACHYYNAADALYVHTLRHGGEALAQAKDLLTKAAELFLAADRKDDWVDAQQYLMKVYRRDGSVTPGKRGNALLQQACEINDVLLDHYSQTDTPLEWIDAGQERISILRYIGERNEGAASVPSLRESLAWSDRVLAVCAEHDLTKQWREVQNSKCIVHERLAHKLGGEEGRAEIARGIATAQLVLDSVDPVEEQWVYSSTKSAMGSLRLTHARMRTDPERLNDFLLAAEDYREALGPLDRDTHTMAWGMFYFNRGLALKEAAILTGDESQRDRFQQAANVFIEVADLFKPPVFTAGWVNAHDELHECLNALAENASGEEETYKLLGLAAESLETALGYVDAEDEAIEWGSMQRKLAHTRARMMDHSPSPEARESNRVASISAFRSSQSVFTKEADPATWKEIEGNLAILGGTTTKQGIFGRLMADFRGGFEQGRREAAKERQE